MLKFLQSSVPIAKSFLFVPRFSGIISGIWPQHHHSCSKTLLFCLSFFFVAVGAVGENLYGFVYINNLSDALEAFCPGVTTAISLLKMSLFFAHNNQWYLIIQRIRAMIMDEQHNKDKIKTMEKYASLANILSFLLVTSGSGTNFFFSLRALVTNLVQMWRGDDFQYGLPFNVVIPEIFRKFPYYPATYCTLTLSGAMTVFTFSFVDGLFLCGCMYMSGLFNMLQYDIRQAFAELKEYDTSTLAQNQRIQRKLCTIVERHNAIIDLCSEFTEKFTLIIIMHFLSAAFVLCSSILDLMLNTTSSLGLLLYLSYSVAAGTQLLLYCVGGTYLSENSVAVAETLYDIEWYKCNVKTRKMILMMLRRSQKAKTIAVPFFTPSLPVFSSIMSTTGSYIALLKTFL